MNVTPRIMLRIPLSPNKLKVTESIRLFSSKLSSHAQPQSICEVQEFNHVAAAKRVIPFPGSGVFSTLITPMNSTSPCYVRDSNRRERDGPSGQIRWYTPMSKDEEDKEKARVSHLTPEEKDEELRKLNREIAKLEMLRGINNGELYTWSGRYKALLRDYGFPLFAYYWVTYGCMFVGTYAAITVGGLDAMDIIARFDQFTGFELAQKVDPALGKMGLCLALNECWEPIRLPFVVATLKPIMETISPPKY